MKTSVNTRSGGSCFISHNMPSDWRWKEKSEPNWALLVACDHGTDQRGASSPSAFGSALCLSLLRALQDHNGLRFVGGVSGHRPAGYYCVALGTSFIELSLPPGSLLFGTVLSSEETRAMMPGELTTSSSSVRPSISRPSYGTVQMFVDCG
jgi:hypothetical protein